VSSPVVDALADPAPPAAPRDSTDDRILDAALRSFETFGLRRTSMEDVARQAGLGRVTLYRRFRSRDALVGAVILREANRFLAELDARVAPLETLAERAEEGFVFTVRAMREHRLVTRLLATEPEAVLPYLTIEGGPLLVAAREYLERLLLELQPSRSRSRSRTSLASEAGVRLMQSFLLTPGGPVDAADERSLRRFARQVIVPLLAA
jgi:AcrR family transcriptional regulator